MIFLQERGREAVVTKAATAFPAYGFGNPSMISGINHVTQSRDNVGVAMLAQFDHDPASVHFLSDVTGCSRASKRIEYPITRTGCDVQNSLDKPFRLRRLKDLFDF